MIEFKRYPHVKEIIEYYARKLDKSQVISFLESGIKSEKEAHQFSKFILLMIDSMAKDMQNNVSVLGSVDNTSMIPDIDYEVSLYLSNIGMEDIWDQVCDEG
ncbi:hypothetical protein [Sessilibacter corallicola]|uniref:Uncharacterized protein n=1 Tax=Sessilibacter corallicola TaxID=2904075 RepID=A0ABQ0A8A3_9GAMM